MKSSRLGAVVAFACLLAPGARAVAQTLQTERTVRIVDLGVRPLFSFPEALGITAELHPFGGRFTVEGGAGMSPLQSLSWNAALKYRFPVYAGERCVSRSDRDSDRTGCSRRASRSTASC